MADARVAAVGLGVGQQHDRLAVGWKLDRAWRHRLGRQQVARVVVQRGAVQAQALAVAGGHDLPMRVQQVRRRPPGACAGQDAHDLRRGIEVQVRGGIDPPAPGVDVARFDFVATAHGKYVALCQTAAGDAAEPGGQVGAGAAQHVGDFESAGHRQVGAGAGPAVSQREFGARGQKQRAPTGQGTAAGLGVDPRSAQRDPRVAFEAQPGAGQGDLQRRRVGGVAHQQVGDRVRIRIQRPGAGHAQVAQAVARPRLDCGGQPRREHPDAHGAASSRLNSVSSMATKRTRCPGTSRHGVARRGSNSRSGVRPMMFQPPGPSRG